VGGFVSLSLLSLWLVFKLRKRYRLQIEHVRARPFTLEHLSPSMHKTTSRMTTSARRTERRHPRERIGKLRDVVSGLRINLHMAEHAAPPSYHATL
jgi:hypothetical protein